jgi:hypothetical protein
MQQPNYSRMNKNNLEDRLGAYISHMRGPGRNYPANFKNWYNAQIAAIELELLRRNRNEAVRRNKERQKARVAKTVRDAANRFLFPLNKPRTATSPPGIRAASAIARHMTPIPYEEAMAAMRAMNRARRARNANRSPKRKSPKRNT